MMIKEKVLQLLREKRNFLQTEFAVSKLGGFGSAAPGQFNDSSDVDILVEFKHPIGFRFVDLAEYLANLLGRRVDLLTSAGIRTIRSKQVAQNITANVIYV